MLLDIQVPYVSSFLPNFPSCDFCSGQRVQRSADFEIIVLHFVAYGVWRMAYVWSSSFPCLADFSLAILNVSCICSTLISNALHFLRAGSLSPQPNPNLIRNLRIKKTCNHHHTTSLSSFIGSIKLPQQPSLPRWFLRLLPNLRMGVLLLWRCGTSLPRSRRNNQTPQNRSSRYQSHVLPDRVVLCLNYADYRVVYQP